MPVAHSGLLYGLTKFQATYATYANDKLIITLAVTITRYDTVNTYIVYTASNTAYPAVCEVSLQLATTVSVSNKLPTLAVCPSSARYSFYAL